MLTTQETKGQWGGWGVSGNQSLQQSSRKEGDWLSQREERSRSVKDKLKLARERERERERERDLVSIDFLGGSFQRCGVVPKMY